MKRTLSCSLVLALCLLLALPAAAGAFFSSAPQYAIMLDADNSNPPVNGSATMTATVTRNGSIAVGQRVIFTWHVKGDSQTPQHGASATTGANSQVTYKLENPGNIARIVTVTAALESDPKITATADVLFGPPGFIAMSERPLNWSNAVAYCQQQGGRLPRINGSDSWAFADHDRITHIDGFGAVASPWPSGLPSADFFWTGTEVTDDPGDSWIVYDIGGEVSDGFDRQSRVNRVVCVP